MSKLPCLRQMVSNENIKIILKSLRYPFRFINFIGTVMAYGLGLKKTPFLPGFIDVEPVNTCMLKCQHCQVTHWNKPSKFLNLGSFQKIIHQFPHLIKLKVQGMGEPLINRLTPAFLKYGKEKKISLKMTTNGMVMNDELVSQLTHLQNMHLIFSLDGASAEVFEKIRLNSNFEKICANIKKITTHKNKKNIEVSFWTLVSMQNLHELSDIVRLSKELRGDHLTFQTQISNWGKKTMDQFTQGIRIERAEIESAFLKAKRAAIKESVDLRISYDGLYTQKKKCPWPWTGTFIASNGDVVPCCVIADSDTLRMGNLFEKPFHEIWNNEKYQELRQRIASHDLPDYCKGCYASN